MPNTARNWWGQTFLTALEQFCEPGRLSRGRSYANGKKVKSFEIDSGHVTAEVRGSVNPYYGVYTEPTYHTEIEFKTISRAQWSDIIAVMASKVSTLSMLLVGEIPNNIEESFEELGLTLLPSKRADFKSQCSCPDWGNPCKHVAGVYYLVAAELDRDPLKLFELRGLSREDLHTELAKTSLGMALAQELTAESEAPEVAEGLYTTPMMQAPEQAMALKSFWQGDKQLPSTIETTQPTSVSAILVKKQGDFPPFWDHDNSFIEAMEEFYTRVRTKNTTVLD